MTQNEVQTFIVRYLNSRSDSGGREQCSELPEDCDLLLSGIVDSLGLLQILNALQEAIGKEIDFDALSSEDLTIVGPLSKFVADKSKE